MLKRMRRCANCGAEIESLRSTKTYCSEACRKRAARGETDLDHKAASRWMVEHLRGMRLIAKIWPVYTWDQSQAIFALMVTTQIALNELNASGLAAATVIESELTRALRDWGVETTDAGNRLKAETKAFYEARKDRRIKKEGYTPSDNGKLAP
jgi:hypothetical protein